MKYIYIIIITIIPFFGYSQQMPKASNFNETNFIWNPAMTGLWEYWEVAATYRQKWLGFADAPKTASVSFQLPFVGNNMSLGANIIHDKTSPMNFNAISVSYAYKIRTGLFQNDQLSLGILATLSEFHLDMHEAQVNDLDDRLLLGDGSSVLKPNAGFGLYYASSSGNDFDENFFFLGAGVNQIYPVDLIFDDGQDANLKRSIHGNAIAGFRFVYAQESYFEPSVWINYASSKILNTNFNLKYEKYNTFWTALNYSTDQTFSLQAGVIVKNGFLKDGTLRIGTLGHYNLGGFGQSQGLGYEFYVAYRFEQ